MLTKDSYHEYQLHRIRDSICVSCGMAPVTNYITCQLCRAKQKRRDDTRAQRVYDRHVEREDRLNNKYHLITIKDAATILSVTTSQVRKLIFRGRIRVHRREMGLAWLSQSEVQSLASGNNGKGVAQ